MLAALGLAIGIACAVSAGLWMDMARDGEVEIRTVKQELVASAGLQEAHNAVYSKVGPMAWENDVKPRFMSAITYATIRESGNPIPEPMDVVRWVRAHPKEARRMLENAASTP